MKEGKLDVAGLKKRIPEYDKMLLFGLLKANNSNNDKVKKIYMPYDDFNNLPEKITNLLDEMDEAEAEKISEEKYDPISDDYIYTDRFHKLNKFIKSIENVLRWEMHLDWYEKNLNEEEYDEVTDSFRKGSKKVLVVEESLESVKNRLEFAKREYDDYKKIIWGQK